MNDANEQDDDPGERPAGNGRAAHHEEFAPLGVSRVRAAQVQTRRGRRRFKLAVILLIFLLANAFLFAHILLFKKDDGRRCVKLILVGENEECARWESREGVHRKTIE